MDEKISISIFEKVIEGSTLTRAVSFAADRVRFPGGSGGGGVPGILGRGTTQNMIFTWNKRKHIYI